MITIMHKVFWTLVHILFVVIIIGFMIKPALWVLKLIVRALNRLFNAVTKTLNKI